jgi:hypothetical protein
MSFPFTTWQGIQKPPDKTLCQARQLLFSHADGIIALILDFVK